MTTGGPLTSARAVVQEPSIVPAGVWGRAAAILARQGLEYALRRRWAAVNWPAMADAKMKHQLIALPTYCEGFADLATEMRFIWAQLSNACHAGTYRLDPSPEQLLNWIDRIEHFESCSTLGQKPTVGLTEARERK